MELFDITKIIFERPNEWQLVTRADKRKYFFLVNRRFAIQHPLQANALQSLRVPTESVMDFWQRFMYNTYGGRTPGWMFMSGAKKSKERKESKMKFGDSIIVEYAKRMELDEKGVRDCLDFFPDEMGEELKRFQKMMGQ